MMKLSPANVWLKPLFILFFGTLIFTSCKNAKRTSAPDLETRLDKIFASVPDFSGVLLVAKKGKPVYHKAFGYKSFLTKEPMETSTIFELASVSKQFTAMTIMQMKEAEKLSFNDPIERYIPGLPYTGITVSHFSILYL